MESDESLRERIRYVSGRQALPGGDTLDRIAEEYGLKRRQIDHERTQPIQRQVWR